MLDTSEDVGFAGGKEQRQQLVRELDAAPARVELP